MIEFDSNHRFSIFFVFLPFLFNGDRLIDNGNCFFSSLKSFEPRMYRLRQIHDSVVSLGYFSLNRFPVHLNQRVGNIAFLNVPFSFMRCRSFFIIPDNLLGNIGKYGLRNIISGLLSFINNSSGFRLIFWKALS